MLADDEDYNELNSDGIKNLKCSPHFYLRNINAFIPFVFKIIKDKKKKS